MKKLFVILFMLVATSGFSLACIDEGVPDIPGINNSNSNTFNPSNTFAPTNTFNPVNTFSPTINSGPTNSFSGIGGSVNPSATAASAQAASSKAPAATGSGTASPVGIGVGGIGQANNSGSGQLNNGIGVQNNGSGVINAGDGAGSVSINQKYEEARQMAVVIGSAVTTALRFKEGAHSPVTDSRIMDVRTVISLLDSVEYEECKRGKGSEGEVKIIDGLIRSQFEKTTSIKFHSKMDNLDGYRFMGFLTGIAGNNDVAMENVVYGIGQKAMEHGATDIVLIKESATEWGDTTGYAFDLGGFVTSIIGGAGSRAIGPGGTAAAGINGMKGGSADRGDAKFAVFVSNERMQQVSSKYEKK